MAMKGLLTLKSYEILKISFLYTLNFLLTDLLMPSAKRNSTMQRAMGLISSLLYVTLSQDVPFCQPQHGYLYPCFFRHYHIGVDSQWACHGLSV